MSLNHSASHNVANHSVASTPKNSHDLKLDISQRILRAVEELQQGSGFGSIEIVLHEGRVTQIEKREKLRFTPGLSQAQ
ncbi:YezD family protein [Flavobacterium sp.]|uniref:YezD family protein n=1 Tax=Flavobacterium sp. TaxID=239 RepID=UPI00286BFD66|nr:YezD family protein [Flavobacterium sp.]